MQFHILCICHESVRNKKNAVPIGKKNVCFTTLLFILILKNILNYCRNKFVILVFLLNIRISLWNYNLIDFFTGLLQNVGSKLAPKSSDKVQESQNSKESDIKSNKVNYSYTDFSLVDHRVKLYLYLHIFQQEGEELVFLIRVSANRYMSLLIKSCSPSFLLLMILIMVFFFFL